MRALERMLGLSFPILCSTLIAMLQADFAHGQESGDWAQRITDDFVEEVQLRMLGPAFRPGRVSDIAVHPRNRSTWYVTVGSGGLWKTTNRGLSWQTLFDDGGSYSLGCVTIDPSNPEVIWLGTGENNSNRSVGFGDGVYKSSDGGESWQHMGLSQSEHISVILVHPRKSNVVYAASEGPLWSPGGDRGLFKTTDGGETWQAVLEVSENTGITGIVFDPRDPEVLYAAAFQRRRHNGLLVGGGPESAIYKTTDGGETWRPLTNGIPDVHKGRIALAVSPQKPDVVYAVIAARGKESGFFRSADGGETWTRQSNYKVIDPQYYGEIYADPHQFDRVYAIDSRVHLTEDGGRTFKPVKWRMHVDNHALSLDPTDVNHLLVGNDGGLYESYDGGSSWRHFVNHPTAQFYRVGLDNSLPFYRVYGGTQDNGSMGGPSRTINSVGIRSSDWVVTGGADGMQSRVDPEDPAIVYTMSQNGGISRLDTRTGQRKGIRPRGDKDGPRLRWHWDSPLIISAHAPGRIYFAGSHLFRSDNRGNDWSAVSGDLTRQLNAHDVPAMGRIWPADAVQKNIFTSTISVATALAESPLQADLLYVGTDDGLVQVSEDGGENWRRGELFPGIPKWAYLSDIYASGHDAEVVYAAFNNYQQGDYEPYLLKSSDRGRSWTSIAANLPARHCVWSIVEDHVNPDLLFVGTEFGLYFSVNGGGRWTELGSGVPVAPFRDLEIQRRESDLVGATFGRGMYVLDDYSALRGLDAETLGQEGTLLPSNGARIYDELRSVSAGPGDYRTPNPASGAVLTYYLREDIPGGSKARVVIAIEDAEGDSVAQLAVTKSAGLHRLVWDFRNRGSGRESRAGASKLAPGEYKATLVKISKNERTVLGQPQTVLLKALLP